MSLCPACPNLSESDDFGRANASEMSERSSDLGHSDSLERDVRRHQTQIGTGLPPCIACGFSRMCRDQRLACDVFEAFVERGHFDRDAPRRPVSRIFRNLFVTREQEGAVQSLGASGRTPAPSFIIANRPQLEGDST